MSIRAQEMQVPAVFERSRFATRIAHRHLAVSAQELVKETVMEKLEVGIWLSLPFLGLLLLLTFVGGPFGGPLTLALVTVVGLVLVATLAMNVPRDDAALVQHPQRRRAMTQPRLSLWDLAFAGLLIFAISAAIFHSSQGRYGHAIVAVVAMIISLGVLVTGWLREPTPEAAAKAEGPTRQAPVTHAAPRQELSRDPRRRLAGWLSMGMLSGFVATGIMTLILLIAYGMAVFVGSADPQAPLLLHWLWGLAHNPIVGTATLALPLAIVLHFLAGMAWAVVYAGLAEPRLSGPGWRRGALFSLLPWLVSVLVFLPLMGGGFLGLSLGAGPLPLLGNLLLHLGYGMTLGELYAAEEPVDLAYWRRTIAAGILPGLVLGGLVGALCSSVLAPGAQPVAVAVVGAILGSAGGAFLGTFLGLTPAAERE